ncbi:hypothetical protein [Methanosphaerula palustris]|uniref:Uncharacterized protein n=1 Tax=Methanosphaerula palustris (strain ATCC BAA-1556 / DSM 19958 / E1-9c) TaxID=521011 RepID=B8GFH1_METPE|nr:hypothetical protein [Methanosphaerula palustris]ACL16019.1 hypothetical protein Mpal_0649 [Methanosphaerula palustris E1-9c]
MTDIRSETKRGVPLHDDLIEERMQELRDTQSSCPACQVNAPFDDLETYQKKIETKIGIETMKHGDLDHPDDVEIEVSTSVRIQTSTGSGSGGEE